MKSTLPLTYEEAMAAIKKLAGELHEMIAHRDRCANHSVLHRFQTLASHVGVTRLSGEIADVVRRYSIECPHCKGPLILGDWHLVDRETLLKCPVCKQFTPRRKHAATVAIEELIGLAPVLVQDLFAQEK